MTKLLKPVSRETAKCYGSRNVVVTLAPCGGQEEARIGLRLKGQRTEYVMALSDCYRWFAEQHGYKERAAKRLACKAGVPWQRARKDFLAGQRL